MKRQSEAILQLRQGHFKFNIRKILQGQTPFTLTLAVHLKHTYIRQVERHYTFTFVTAPTNTSSASDESNNHSNQVRNHAPCHYQSQHPKQHHLFEPSYEIYVSAWRPSMNALGSCHYNPNSFYASLTHERDAHAIPPAKNPLSRLPHVKPAWQPYSQESDRISLRPFLKPGSRRDCLARLAPMPQPCQDPFASHALLCFLPCLISLHCL